MKAFRSRLAKLDTSGTQPRGWVFVPYDQLTDQVGPLAETQPEAIGIVLVESGAKAARRPYHKQKLALVLANQRHFALEQAARGVAVEYVAGAGTYAELLGPVIDRRGPLEMMRAAERELRVELAGLARSRPGRRTTARGMADDT